jgi:hypothetical protein
MREIAPGLWHWTARHPHIGTEVSSYYLADERVALDPLVPPEGIDWFADRRDPPEHVLLTNRHHDRDSSRLRERFGSEVHCAHAALAVADGVVRWSDGNGLSFVPDSLMDEPEETKRGLRDAYRALLELDFELLLLAHGDPVTAAARRELRDFVGG